MKATVMYPRFLLWLGCFILLGWLLSSCGFHLRGTGTTGIFGFSTIYIDNPNFVKAGELTKISLISRGIKIVDDPKEADVVLNIYAGAYTSETLTVNANGQVSQYRFRFQLDYQIAKPLASADAINTSRDLDFDASQYIAKESEQRILREDMESDVSERLVRVLSRLRIDVLTTPAADTSPPSTTSPTGTPPTSTPQVSTPKATTP